MEEHLLTKRILLYIENHLDEELSAARIAEALHYSGFYITRVFKSHTGITLHKYIQGRRMDEAAKKLAETEKPIAEIAFEAGYGSQQAFTLAFRSIYLITPQKYRMNGIYIPKQQRIFMGMGADSVTVLLSFQRTGGKFAA